MKSVLVLIGNPAAQALDSAAVSLAAAALKSAGATPGLPDWLAPGIACDIPFDGLAPDQALMAAALALNGRPLDLAALPQDGRRKQLLVADMDSTMITVECIDELADMAGVKHLVAPITERAMRGELDFEGALIERVALLKGLPESVLAETYEKRVRLMPGARALIQTMKANGAVTALVSGGFTFFTQRVAEAAGFSSHRANRLELADGQLTGKVIMPILGREAKLARLNELMAQHGIAAPATMAVGDGANDLAMVKASGLGVAYHAKPVVAAEAHVSISHGDLTALLYLQGYKQTGHAA